MFVAKLLHSLAFVKHSFGLYQTYFRRVGVDKERERERELLSCSAILKKL